MLFLLLVILFIIIYSYGLISKNNDKISSSISSDKAYMKNIGFCNDSDFGYDDSIYGYCVHVYIDDHNKKLLVANGMISQRYVLNYNDILGMEVQEDGVHTNGVGRAVVGGALFGGTGAVVGAVTGKKTVQNIRIILYLKDVINPKVEINFIDSRDIKCDSDVYRYIRNFANHLDATVRAIIANNENSQVENSHLPRVKKMRKGLISVRIR